MRKKYRLKKSRPFLYKPQSQALRPSTFITKKESQKVREEIWYKIRRNVRRAESRLLYLLIKPYKVPKAKHQDFRKKKGRERNQSGSYFFLQVLKPRTLSIRKGRPNPLLRPPFSSYSQGESLYREGGKDSLSIRDQPPIMNSTLSLHNEVRTPLPIGERPFPSYFSQKTNGKPLQKEDYNYHLSETLYRLESLPLFSQESHPRVKGEDSPLAPDEIFSRRSFDLLYGSTERKKRKKRLFKVPMRIHWGGEERMIGLKDRIRERMRIKMKGAPFSREGPSSFLRPLSKGYLRPLWIKRKERGKWLRRLGVRKKRPFWDRISFSAQKSLKKEEFFKDQVKRKRGLKRSLHSLLYSYRSVIGKIGRKGGKRVSSFFTLIQEKRKWYQLYPNLNLPEIRREGRQAYGTKSTPPSSPFISLLESRLDLFYSRFCPWESLNQIRERIGKGEILVNNQVQNLPNLQLYPGDIVSVCNKSGGLETFRKRGLHFFENLFTKKPLYRLRLGGTNQLILKRIKPLKREESSKEEGIKEDLFPYRGVNEKGKEKRGLREVTQRVETPKNGGALDQKGCFARKRVSRYPHSSDRKVLSSRFVLHVRLEGRGAKRKMRLFREGAPFLPKGSWGYRKEMYEKRRHGWKDQNLSLRTKERKDFHRRKIWAYKWWKKTTSRSNSDSRGVNLYRLLFLSLSKSRFISSLPPLSRISH